MMMCLARLGVHQTITFMCRCTPDNRLPRETDADVALDGERDRQPDASVTPRVRQLMTDAGLVRHVDVRRSCVNTHLVTAHGKQKTTRATHMVARVVIPLFLFSDIFHFNLFHLFNFRNPCETSIRRKRPEYLRWQNIAVCLLV